MTKILHFIKFLNKYTHVFFSLFGLLVVMFYKFIGENIAYFFGGITLVLGAFFLFLSLINCIIKKYKTITLVCSVLLTIIGVVLMVFANKEVGITLVVIFWVINEVVKFLIHLIFGVKQLQKKEKSGWYTLAIGIVILVMAALLVFHGEHGIVIHIIFYGVETMLSSILFYFGVKDGFSLWELIDYKKGNE